VARDESRLKTDPAQIRRRLRRKTKHLNDDLRLYAKHGGFKEIKDWDLEELARGKPREANGRFRGGPVPKWITGAITVEIQKRLKDEAFKEVTQHISLAVQTVVKLLKSEELDDKGKPLVSPETKLKAAIFIIEHVIGKSTTKVELAAEDFTKKMIASAIVLDDGRPQDERVVLEGEIVEEENDDDGE